MTCGDTMIVTLPQASVDSHLWIVISDPDADPDKVVIVNMTSWREDKDQACILNIGDHPYVSRRTCINYGGAKVVTRDGLDALMASGKVKADAKCSDALLLRIRNGVADSRMSLGIVEVLVNQGVIDEP